MITLSQQILTPMLRLVLQWPAVEDAESYVVKLLEAGDEDDPTEQTTSETKVLVTRRLKNATWYHLQVVALDGDDSELDATAVINVWTNGQKGTSAILRQAVFDAINYAAIATIDDGYFQPRALGRTAATSDALPAVEVSTPKLGSNEPLTTGNYRTQGWEVPIEVITQHDKGDPDNNDALFKLFERVQAAVESHGLKLNRWGVLEGNWSWSEPELNSKGRRLRTTTLKSTLTVPVRRDITRVLFPQPASTPEEPEAPESL